ncbi:MAG: putative mannose-phosphate guanyltransferase [Candidatus Sulfotelmatobacter sp.]|nr:putative mannose-phosphate guanyltransferase [Candidatus Sulfotelmatobacter sp.]
MGLGAILVVGTGLQRVRATSSESEPAPVLAEPLTCIDVMGRSMMERTVERFARAGVEVISVLVSVEMAHAVQPCSVEHENLSIQVVADVSAGVTQKLRDFSREGIEHAFVMSADLYTEADLLDLFYFHREAKQTATRTLDAEGSLSLWVIDCAKAQHADLEDLLAQSEGAAALYIVRDYVNRLEHPRDLRRLVSDALRGRCVMRPSGVEIRPGIWVDEGAEIHRRARVVAPAYIGRNAKLLEDTLITRCSNIEKGCYVDYGTVIEDSSILANTHVGIWLDVCHAVVNGNKLLSLGRNVTLEISDRSIMRTNGSAREEAGNNSLDFYEAQQVITDLEPQQQEPRTPKAWQFGANLIQG